MAITVSFNGATIRKPGSYSKTVIDLGGNFPLSPVGIVGLIGEAPRGAAGSAELIANNLYRANQMTVLQDKYGAGSQIADAASLAFNPSNDGNIVNGAQAAYVYKTNASQSASLTLANSYGVVTSDEPGEGGNLASLAIEVGTAEALPQLAGIHYLPNSSASGASDYAVSVNGAARANLGVIAGYTASAGGEDAFATAANGISGLSATGGAATALFSATDNTTTLSAANASGVTTLAITGGAGAIGACAAGDTFVVSGLATASFNGVYLCTTASTSTTVSGVKLKDLATNGVTIPVAGSLTFSAANTASRSFKSLTLAVTSAQAQGQGASLQLAALSNSVYGGTARNVLSSTIGNVGTIAMSGSLALATVTLTGGTWVEQPKAGDLCWILPDSQLAGVSGGNCGAWYVSASTQTTATLVKVDQTAGSFSAISATLISAAGVTANLRCFAGAVQNAYSASVLSSQAEETRIIVLDNTRDQVIETSSETGGKVALRVGYAGGGATAAAMTIDLSTNRLTTAITGNSTANLNINLLQYPTLQALVNYLNALPGYAASVDSALANTSPLKLDEVAALGILSLSTSPVATPGRVKKDVSDIEAVFAASAIASATIAAKHGLPAAATTAFLAGGTVGATSASDILAALDQFEKVRINTVVPLFSRDASLDIAEGLTDQSSTYLIDSIHAAVKSHCTLMSNTQNRSERHCVLAFRGSYADAKTKAANLSSFRAQMVFQDVNALSTGGNTQWMQPHMLAAEVAGMRSGAVVGMPLTFKFFNISGLRHTASPLLTPADKVTLDFDPRTMYDDAIDAGLTFLENPASGGFRMVVDNTTYTKDDNWVYNRMSTLHAADIVAYDFRTRLENTLVGSRNTDWTAVSIRSLCESLLTGYKNQGLLGSTAAAPNGYSNLSISLNGNTVLVNVSVILVEGIDFVLSTITLQRNSTSA